MIAPLLLAVDFMNFTYADNPCQKNVPVPVVMQRGTFSYYDKGMGTGFDLHVAAVKEGSLASGTRQAVVVIACDFPVGGTAAAYAFDERKNTASLLSQVATANWGGDWGRGPDSIHIRFTNRFLYVDACKDDDCTTNVVATYAYRSGKLVKVFVETRKNLLPTPAPVDQYHNQAVTYDGKGQYALGAAAWTKALQLAPNNDENLLYRAHDFVYTGQFGRAIADYNRAEQLGNRDDWLHWGRGIVGGFNRSYTSTPASPIAHLPNSTMSYRRSEKTRMRAPRTSSVRWRIAASFCLRCAATMSPRKILRMP